MNCFEPPGPFLRSLTEGVLKGICDESLLLEKSHNPFQYRYKFKYISED
jgi:hypothetical protein